MAHTHEAPELNLFPPADSCEASVNQNTRCSTVLPQRGGTSSLRKAVGAFRTNADY